METMDVEAELERLLGDGWSLYGSFQPGSYSVALHRHEERTYVTGDGPTECDAVADAIVKAHQLPDRRNENAVRSYAERADNVLDARVRAVIAQERVSQALSERRLAFRRGVGLFGSVRSFMRAVAEYRRVIVEDDCYD